MRPVPPAVAEWLVRRMVPGGPARQGLVGDLRQEFVVRAEEDPAGARWWYRRQALGVVRAYGPVRIVGLLTFHPTRGDSIMHKFSHELRQSWRRLLKAPGFSAVAALTLALGLGANVAIFAVLNGVVLKPLPYDEPEQLYGTWHSAAGLNLDQIEMSNALFHLYRTEVPGYESIGIFATGARNLTGIDVPERVTVTQATHDLFTTLRVSPALGRIFGPADEERGAPRVVLLSDAFWRERFGGDPGVVGSTIMLNDVAHEVVGVMPRGFAFPDGDTQIWRAVQLDPNNLTVTSFNFNGIARLRPGATPESVAREVDAVIARLPELFPRQVPRAMWEQAQLHGFVRSYRDDVIGDIGTRLWILLGMVGLVLTIACANVANLFLVRSESRRREVALRTALGASGADLARLHFAESVLLAGVGGLAGVAIAWASVRGFIALSPAGIPRLSEISVGLVVWGYAAALTVAAAFVLGLFPTLKSRLSSLARELHEGGRANTVGRERHLMRHVLVAVQVAMATTLLVGSGLLLRSFFHLRSLDPGYDASDVATMRIALPTARYDNEERVEQFYAQLLNDLRSAPGVRSVAAASDVPLRDRASTNGWWIEDFYQGDDKQLPMVVDSRVVTTGYFETLDIPIVAGRMLNRDDALNRTGAVVVSEAFARNYWQSLDVLGKRVKSAQGGNEEWSTIVGVAGDTRSVRLADDPTQTIYVPPINNPHWDQPSMALLVEADVPIGALVERTRSILATMDPDLPIASITTMKEVVSRSMARESFTTFLLSVAAGIALFLGAIGIYGVISYIFSQRAAEMGVRLALGARTRNVAGLVVRQSLMVTLIGIAAGIAASVAVGQTLETFLYGTTPYDPLILTSVPALLVVVAVMSSLLPALRAMRIDPAVVMRAE